MAVWMSLSAALLALLSSDLFITGVVSRTLSVENQCSYTVWPAILSTGASSQLSPTGFALQPGSSKTLDAPASWNGRLWGRTHCTEDPATGNFSCLTGDCNSGEVECSGYSDHPVTLAEISLNGVGGLDFYDVSLVDGYNIPMQMSPGSGGGGGGQCTPTGCVLDLNRACPPELRVRSTGANGSEAIVTCQAACRAFKEPRYCCTGDYSSPGTCPQTSYSQAFKIVCPRAYTYPYDDISSTFTCASADYLITFCPLSDATSTPIQPTVNSDPTVYLDSTHPPKWFNNNTINMTIRYSDKSMIRPIISRPMYAGFISGFYCIDACNSYLFGIVAVGGDASSLVWAANRFHPVQENATLQLTRDGDLLLLDSDGTYVWSTDTSAKSVRSMNITESGNLVLSNDKGAIVWQSFDHPTDTLLRSQRLSEGQNLTSGSSGTNWSHGQYYATLTPSAGFAAFVQVSRSQPQMYYRLMPNGSSATSVKGPNYAMLVGEGLLVRLGETQTISGKSLSVASVQYVKLDSDGHLKIYQHHRTDGLNEIVDLVQKDFGACQYPRSCDDYGICRDGQCTCPEGVGGVQYFRRSEDQLTGGSCSRITPLTCEPSPDEHHLIEVRNVTYFNVIDSDAVIPRIKNIEGCKQACLANCSCGGAFFEYERNASDGYCYMPSEILATREGRIPNHNFSSTAFIKVQIPYVAPSSPPVHENKRNLTATIAGSSAGAIVLISFIIILLVAMRARHKTPQQDDIGQVARMPIRFSYEDLRVATEDFKEELGGGGFGSVFKGMLENGTRIAVKRLDKMGQGTREFLAEVETIGSLHHFNLVRLVGFCAEKSCRLLVYEYMCNGSLDKWIFRSGDDESYLDWQTRKKIILDIAKGLAYLHEDCRQRIAHLDIKPQNILLDENFNAKVSDFGLSRLIDRDESQVLTHMRGTPGYLAPEWRELRITVKVDIYSFGIVLLEVVCGRRNLDRFRSESSLHLLRLLQEKAEQDRLIDIVDNLDEEEVQSHREEVVRMIRIGAWCLQDDHARRPLMSTVVKVLEGLVEVDENIVYKFTHALAPPSIAAAAERTSTVPQASVLSAPR